MVRARKVAKFALPQSARMSASEMIQACSGRWGEDAPGYRDQLTSLTETEVTRGVVAMSARQAPGRG